MTSSNQIVLPPVMERINEKFDESEFFLEKMCECAARIELGRISTSELRRENQMFRFYTSAFLNAVRSPLQYMLSHWEIAEEEKKNKDKKEYKKEPKAWYDKECTKYPLLRFLTDQRDINIHSMQPKPRLNVVVNASANDLDKDVQSAFEWYIKKETQNPQEEPKYEGRDVLSVSPELVNLVRAFVFEAVRKGYLG